MKRIFIIIALFVFSAMFYFGMYKYFMERDSTSIVYEKQKHRAVTSDNSYSIILLGDSTAANGFDSVFFNMLSEEKILDLAIGGSWLFTQHKLAEHIKSSNPNIKTVVVIFGPDQFIDSNNYRIKSNIEYCKTDLDFRDIYTLWIYKAGYFEYFDSVARYVYRPLLYNKDIQHFIKNPMERISQIPVTMNELMGRGKEGDARQEDGGQSDVCNICALDELEKYIKVFRSEGNLSEVKRLEVVLSSYAPRKNKKSIADGMRYRIDRFIEFLSKKFETVYVLYAPIYNNFDQVYSNEFKSASIEMLMSISGEYKNVEYVHGRDDINDKCENFMDVVHLNRGGATRYTEHIYDYIRNESSRKAGNNNPSASTVISH